MRSPALARTASAVVALATSLAGAPAHGGWTLAWMEERPKLVTFKLDDPAASRLPLLDAFRDAAVDPAGGLRHYTAGQWGRWRKDPWWQLAWSPSRHEGDDGAIDGSAKRIFFGADDALSLPPEAAPAWLDRWFRAPVFKTPFAIFASNGSDALFSIPPAKPIPNWRCRRRPVRMARYGGETEAFPMVRCDGSVAPEAFDRLTLMVREALAPRPGELLPDEPDPGSLARGEWTPGVRLVHPRLLWALQRIADAFPWRTIYVFSGYRHDPSGAPPKPGTHHSMHSEARALDINVMGIPTQQLFKLCHELEDVGCGFYPNNKFVHVDIRRPGSGHPFWIDVSGPGEPSRYVDAWPGVIEGGGLSWDAATKRGESSQTGVRESAERGPASDAARIRRGGT